MRSKIRERRAGRERRKGDALLDDMLDQTFPASDPPALSTAADRQERRKGDRRSGTGRREPRSRQRRTRRRA